MIWLLPIIVIGGLFNPYLGYLVIGMMIFLLSLSFFKRRYWCWNLCPRGAFLDMVVSKASSNKKIPGLFTKMWFRFVVFISFMSFLTYRIMQTGGSLVKIGAVFVLMCLVTTIISIILGTLYKHRGWCMICPMGFLQERIYNLPKKKKIEKK